MYPIGNDCPKFSKLLQDCILKWLHCTPITLTLYMAIYVNLFVVQIRTCSSQLRIRNGHTSVLTTICLHMLFKFILISSFLWCVQCYIMCPFICVCVCMCMDGLLRRRLQICIDIIITCMDQKPVYMDPWSKYVYIFSFKSKKICTKATEVLLTYK